MNKLVHYQICYSGFCSYRKRHEIISLNKGKIYLHCVLEVLVHGLFFCFPFGPVARQLVMMGPRGRGSQERGEEGLVVISPLSAYYQRSDFFLVGPTF